MALGSTQPLTEVSTRNVSWEQRRPVRRADNLTTFMCRLSGSRNLLEPSGPVQACNGIALLFCNYDDASIEFHTRWSAKLLVP